MTMVKTTIIIVTLATVCARLEAAAQRISRGDYSITVLEEGEIVVGVDSIDVVDVVADLAAGLGLVVHSPELEVYVTKLATGAEW